MNRHQNCPSERLLRRNALYVCLTAVVASCGIAAAPQDCVASTMGSEAASDRVTGGDRLYRAHGGRSLRVPPREHADRPAGAVSVTSCTDDGSPGTLRATLLTTVSGDTVDLRSLTCSTITLASGALVIANDDLTIIGPGATQLAIDANGQDSAFIHAGAGTFGIEGVTVANGTYDADVRFPLGGCLYSTGNIALTNAVVMNCNLRGLNYAYGGAVYAVGVVTIQNSSIVTGNLTVTTRSGRGAGGLVFATDVYVDHSTLSGGVLNAAYASRARGGAIYVPGNLHVAYSTVTSNSAVPGFGGAAFTFGAVHIESSTLSNNSADYGAALSIFRNFANPSNAYITNSTISGNVVAQNGSAVESSIAMTLSNSTIAFNVAYGDYQTPGAGLRVPPGLMSDIESSIIANNTAGGAASDFTATDLFNLTGANNLIMAATDAEPAGTLSADPLLAPLANNGGTTVTHALQPGSPAIDVGNNVAALAFDQRADGFERIVGGGPDIGAFESGNDRIFRNGFD